MKKLEKLSEQYVRLAVAAAAAEAVKAVIEIDGTLEEQKEKKEVLCGQLLKVLDTMTTLHKAMRDEIIDFLSTCVTETMTPEELHNWNKRIDDLDQKIDEEV